jgi:hypothetical protein
MTQLGGGASGGTAVSDAVSISTWLLRVGIGKVVLGGIGVVDRTVGTLTWRDGVWVTRRVLGIEVAVLRSEAFEIGSVVGDGLQLARAINQKDRMTL